MSHNLVGTLSSCSSGSDASEVHQLWDQLRQKDAQILMLQKKLGHFRSWVSTIQGKVHQVNPQLLKNSKRLYVGGVSPNTSEEDLKHFLNTLMIKTGALTAPGSAILSVKITQVQEKNFAFVEFRSVEETSNAMAFDGIAYQDTYLRFRRPSNYDAAASLALGPVTPDPTMDLSTLDICRTIVEDSPAKLFVGGLPCDWTEEQVKELLTPYGGLQSFNLVMDKATGKSKGYAFCEYIDKGVTDEVIKCLSGKRIGSKCLTVKRALEGALPNSPMSAASPSHFNMRTAGIMSPLSPAGMGGRNAMGLPVFLPGYPSPNMPNTPPSKHRPGVTDFNPLSPGATKVPSVNNPSDPSSTTAGQNSPQQQPSYTMPMPAPVQTRQIW